MNKRTTLSLSIGLALLAATGMAAAGGSSETPGVFTAGSASLPFEFQPPGARALALGGAFSAVADDATAAEANPAGMTILARPEVSLHVRHSDYDIRQVNPDVLDIFGDPLDPFDAPDFSDNKTKVSFASFVYPFEVGTVALFYQNSGTFDTQNFLTTFDDNTFLDFYDINSSLGAELTSFGVSGAIRVTDLVSFGVSVKRSELELTSVSASQVDYFRDFEFDLAAAIPGTTPQSFIGQFNDRLSRTITVDGDDSDITYNAGLLLNPNGKWSFSMVYRENGKYRLPLLAVERDAFNCGSLPSSQCTGGFDNTTVLPITEQIIELPDVFSFGFAWRPTDTWLVALQADRVHYSRLSTPRGFSLVFVDSAQNLPDGTVLPLDPQEIENEWNPRIGVEKAFPMGEGKMMGLSVFTVRAGAFREQDHDGFDQIDTENDHFTVGVGAVFGEDLQIDFAADFSDFIDNYVVSAVYRF
jgi:long-subunit fatty acid transport protein